MKFAILKPAGINIEELVNVHSSSLDKNYLYLLIHYVLSRLSNYIEKEKENIFDFYIPIYTKALMVSWEKHNKHIVFLGTVFSENINIFFRKNFYKGKSFSYKISPHFHKKNIEVTFIETSILTFKAVKSLSLIHQVVKNKAGAYNFLLKYFNSKHLTIDIDRALVFSKHRFNLYKDYVKHLKELAIITDIYNGIYKIAYQSKTDARLHTCLTKLPRVYRKFIKFKGKRLIEVDLCNSNLFFLGLLINDKIQLSNSTNDNSLQYIFRKTSVSITPVESQLLMKLASDGLFYEYFVPLFDKVYSEEKYKKIFNKKSNDEYLGTEAQKRKIVKNILLKTLFAKTTQFTIEQSIFSNVFPTLLKKINKFKEENGYEKFSHLLFQIEANYMLNVLARDFNRKFYRYAPVFTLHDCLITTEDFKDQLINVFDKVFNREFGVVPKLKTEIW